MQTLTRSVTPVVAAGQSPLRIDVRTAPTLAAIAKGAQ